MDIGTIGKYLAALVLMGSVFYLVLIHLVDATTYLTLVVACLGAIGVHVGTSLTKGTP